MRYTSADDEGPDLHAPRPQDADEAPPGYDPHMIQRVQTAPDDPRQFWWYSTGYGAGLIQKGMHGWHCGVCGLYVAYCPHTVAIEWWEQERARRVAPDQE